MTWEQLLPCQRERITFAMAGSVFGEEHPMVAPGASEVHAGSPPDLLYYADAEVHLGGQHYYCAMFIPSFIGGVPALIEWSLDK